MYLLDLENPHSPPPPSTLPSMSRFLACSTSCAPHLSNSAFAMKTKPDLAVYYHRAAFCPVPSTFISAINAGNFSSWPGLTADLISKHLPKSIATAKGNNKLARKNIQSTRRPVITPAPSPEPPIFSATTPAPPPRSKTIRMTVIEPNDLLATNLTGRFPTISSRGCNYIIVCYIYDTHGIIVRPIKNRSTAEHI